MNSLRTSGYYYSLFGIAAAFAFAYAGADTANLLLVFGGAGLGTLLVGSGYLIMAQRRAGLLLATFTCALLLGYYAYNFVLGVSVMMPVQRLIETSMLVLALIGLAIGLSFPDSASMIGVRHRQDQPE